MSEPSSGPHTPTEGGSAPEISGERVWRMVGMASLLSLDVVLPFYEAMGLSLSDPSRFQQALRQLIVSERSRYDDNKPFPDLLAATCHDLAQHEGEAQARAFRRWFDHLYMDLPLHQLQWSLWLDAFQQGFDPKVEPERQLLSGEQQEQAVAAYAEFMDIEELRQQAESVSGQPLSDWDLEIYVRHDFDHDDDEMDNPFLRIFAIVEIARVQAFAYGFVPMLTAQEHEQLREQAAWLVAEISSDQPLSLLSEIPSGLMGMGDGA